MEFIWHDGGRTACGFVGLTSDCVPRAIAIATGEVYRDVYDQLHALAASSPRQGVTDRVFTPYLAKRGWQQQPPPAGPRELPRGVVLVSFRSPGRNHAGHLCCVIDHTVYDTWNPFEDATFLIDAYWTCETVEAGDQSLPARGPARRPLSDQAQLTQHEFERILKRVRALHNTASNAASTEGEVRNALRAMQALMLKHNLSRNDIQDDDNVEQVGMTRRACPLNGRRACQWELSLASYLTEYVFPSVQHYTDRRGHRTLYWFYGPVDDVTQALGLFQELLLTIATTARLKYGGYARGSGASYAEGYVAGLPKEFEAPQTSGGDARSSEVISHNALVHTRMLALQSAATEWLAVECGIRLVRSTSYSGRYSFDHSAHREGTRDGAKHDTMRHHKTKRLPGPQGN